MAIINTKLIKYATQARFDIDIAKVPAVIDSKSIVFVQDTGRIYAHGKYFGGAWGDITDKPKTFAPASHTHGSITNDGKIGTSADRIIETTTGGALTHVAKNTAYNRAFGTGKDQVAMGNHTHAYLPLTGGTLTGALSIDVGAASQTLLTLKSAGVSTSLGSLNGSYFHMKTDATSGFYSYQNITAPNFLGKATSAGSADNSAKLGNTTLGGLFTTLTKTTDNKLSITVGGTNKTLALGSNAFDSTAYLPLSGGTLGNTAKLEIRNNSAGISNVLQLTNTSSSGRQGTSIFFKGYFNQALISSSQIPSAIQGGDLHLQTYSTDSVLNTGIYLDRTGKVGINTITPSYNLDVSGTGRFTGNVTAPTFIGNLTGLASLNLPLTGGTITGALTIKSSANAGKDVLLTLGRSSAGYGDTQFSQSYDNRYYSNGKTLDIDLHNTTYLSLAGSNNTATGKIIAHKPIEYLTGTSDNWNTAYTYSQIGHLPLSGGTMSGSINYTNTSGTNPMLVMNRASGGGAALARLNITGYDKGLGLSNNGDLIFGDWSGVSTLSTS